MRRVIILFALILLVCSCGTTKKITQTKTHSKVNVQTSLLDTSKRNSSWELVVSSLVNTIDLSKIKITTFYPTKDSTGEQLVKEIVMIDKNIIVTKAQSEEEVKTEAENNGITLNSGMSGENDNSILNSVEKKMSVNSKLLIGSAFVLVLAFIWVILKFRKWLFWFK